MDKYINMVLIDYDGKQKQIVRKFGVDRYAINDDYPNVYPEHGSLWSVEDIEKLITLQDKFVALIEKRKQDAIEEEIQAKKQFEIEKQKNNLYGFTDGKSKLQAGKINTILQKTSFYKIDGKVDFCSRKDFVIKFLKEGYLPEKYEYQDVTKVISYNNMLNVPSREYEEYTKKVFAYIEKKQNTQVLLK